MSEPKRYSFWGMIVHLPGGGVRPEVHFKIDEDGLFVGYPDYEKLKAEVERLRKAGDLLAFHYISLGRKFFPDDPLPPSITEWNAAKEGKKS